MKIGTLLPGSLVGKWNQTKKRIPDEKNRVSFIRTKTENIKKCEKIN
jgi:hypothetical protein